MLLRYDEVGRWLLEQEPSTICGYRTSAVSCPLAQYLRAKTGYLYAVADTYGPSEATYPETPDEPLPRWAEAFLELVDRGGVAYAPVSVAEALAHLELAALEQQQLEAD